MSTKFTLKIILPLLLCISPKLVLGQPDSADYEYNMLNKLLYLDHESNIYSYSKKDSLLFRNIFIEQMYQNYRNLGKKLWYKYPTDERKYDWLEQTINHSRYYNHYWKNLEEGMQIFLRKKATVSKYTIPLNKKEIEAWEAHLPKMLKEYKIHLDNDNNNRSYNLMLVRNLRNFLTLSLNMDYRKNDKIDLHKLRNILIPAAERALTYEIDSSSNTIEAYKEFRTIVNYYLTSNFKEYGVTVSDIQRFFKNLEEYPNPLIKRWARNQYRISLLLADQDIFNFKTSTIDGFELDFQKLRGKVVLFDFWSIYCTSCISKMPDLKRVYDKYKDQGFVVISACLNDENALIKVKNIKSKIGADWPTALIGESSRKNSLGFEIWNKYGFFGVPQLLLFNKRGKFVLLNDILLYGDFDFLIKQLIGERI